MITTSIILLSSLALIGLVILSFGIGRGLSVLASRPIDLVADIINGLLLVVSGYAIFKSGGHTILLPIPLLVLFLVFRKKDQDNEKISIKPYSRLLALAFLFYWAIFLLTFFSWEPGMARVYTGDSAFYARLAAFLNDKGVENYRFDHGSSDMAVMPYHYFDCWTAALCSRIFGLNTHYAMILVVYPLLASLIVLVVFHWLRKESRADWKTGTVSLLTPLFCGIGFLYPSFLITAEVWDYSILGEGKLLCPAVIFVWMLFFLRKNDISRAIVLWIIIVLCSTTLLTAMALLSVYVLLQAFLKNKIQSLIPSLAIAFISAGYFTWFYRNSEFAHIQIQYSATEYIIRSIKMMVGGILEIALWLPIIIIGWSLFKKRNFPVLSEVRNLVVFVFGGLLGWVICWPMHVEYQQFFESAFVLGTALLTALVIVNSLDFFNRAIFIPIILFFLFFVVQNLRMVYYGAEELEKADIDRVKDFLQRNGTGNFASYREKAAYTSYYSLLTQTYPALPWLGYLREPYESFSLDTWELREEWKNMHSMGYAVEVLDKAPYTIFAKDHPELGGNEKAQVFVQKRNIHYLLVAKDAANDLKEFKINDSLKISRGWRIYHF